MTLSSNLLNGSIPFLPSSLVSIDVHGNFFKGAIPYLPIGLTLLRLESNLLTGGIPFNLPSGLTLIYLNSNRISGSVPSLPSGLISLRLNTNNLTGIIPALPSSLNILSLNSNKLTGTIPVLPNALKELNLDNNFLTGSIPSIPDSLSMLSLSNNQLSGTVPPLTSNNIEYVYLDRNLLSGTLIINNPKQLTINDNYFTDVVLTTNSSLEVCDFSKNPLLGNSHAIELDGCVAVELYAASLLPFTLTSIRFKSITPTAPLLRTGSNAKTISHEVTLTTKEILATSISTHTEVFYSSTTFQPNRPYRLTQSSVSLELEENLYTDSRTIDKGSSIVSKVLMTTSMSMLQGPDNSQKKTEPIVDPTIIYALISAIVGLCVLLIVASKLVKNPKINSKFGRKNSFGTLNTVKSKE